MIESYEVSTGIKLIEKERQRLIKLKSEDKDWWKSRIRSDWARGRFGKTLKEKNGQTNCSGSPASENRCDVCKIIPDYKGKIILLYISDYEYSDITICKSCIKKIYKKINEK